MAQEIVATPPPLNFLGKYLVERKGSRAGQLYIKSRALAPIRDTARLLALREGVIQRFSTGGRFENLLVRENYRELAKLGFESYDILLRLRTRFGLSKGDSGKFIRPEVLTKMEKDQLSNSFDVVRMLQQFLRREYHIALPSR